MSTCPINNTIHKTLHTLSKHAEINDTITLQRSHFVRDEKTCGKQVYTGQTNGENNTLASVKQCIVLAKYFNARPGWLVVQ